MTLLTAIREGGGSSIFESLADAIKMESFSANLVLFGQALGEYCSAVSSDKVDTDLLTDTATAAGPLVTLLTAIREGGGSSIFTSISGAVNMTAFSTNLSLFGQALGSYCSSVGSDKVDTDLLTDTATAAGPLVTLLTAIREGGGSSIFASISGATNMAAFNANLALFGQSLSEYCSAVSGDKVNTDLLADTATAAGPLVTLLTTIRDNGGSSIFASFANAINMAAFNINLAAFGQALGMFSATAIQYRINPEAIKQTAEVAKPLVELLTTIREGGGTNIFSSLSDAINMTSFNSNLVEFAKALVAFSDKIEESYPSYYAISYATMCAKPFIDLLGELKDKKLNNITISASLADNMANFGDALTAYSNSVEGLNFDNMKAATEEASALFDIFNSLEDVDTLSKYVEALTNLGNVSSTGFGTGIANSSDEVKTAINGMLQIVIVAMNEFSIKIKTSGENAAGSYSKGFAAITDKVISVFKTVYSNVGTNTYNAMYNIGRNAGEGMVQGLRSKKNDIVAAADDLGTAAARQEQRTLRVNSPSKVFYGIFLSCGEGAVLALADSCEDVGKASDDLGNTAIKSISDAISNINMDEIDTTPVISPVLDLNNIRKNAPEINKLVGGNVMYGFDSINKTAGLKNQNRFGSNVLKAIDGLNDNLSNINSNSYVINGLNVSDANVAEVIQTLVRAMNIERRM